MAKRKSSITGQFTARLVEMQESPAYRILSLSAHRALSRIEIELRHHGGEENGQLPVTFDNFVEYGIHRTSIGPALAELEALGFIITHRAWDYGEGGRVPPAEQFRLTTYPELTGVGPEGCRWRRFRTLEEAFTAAEAARTFLAKRKSRQYGKRQKPVRKTYRGGRKRQYETVPLHVSETVPLSISREGDDQTHATRPRATARSRWRSSPSGPSPSSGSSLARRR